MPRILYRFKAVALSLSLFDSPLAKSLRVPVVHRARTMTSLGCFDHSIHQFLSAVKQEPTNHMVIGNTAGDADSIVSAIAHAYVSSAQKSTRNSDFAPHQFLTPIVSITQQDLEATRPETLLLLKWAGLPTNSLLYVDDTQVQSRVTRATLVDHNHLVAEAYQHCEVVEILDHHKDDQKHKECQKRHIAYSDGKVLAASTCTLVVEALMEHRIQLPPHSQAALSTLLLGVILLDSVNLKEAAGKVTARDRAAVSFLIEGTDWSQSGLPPNCLVDGRTPVISKVFDALQQSKFDRDFWMSLSVRDSLRLDYKSFLDNAFGMSSVLIAWNDFKEKSDLVASIRLFMEENNISVLVVMLACQAYDGTLKRELALYSKESADREKIAEHLGKTELDLRPLANSFDELEVYEQGNSKASRKQVAPLLEAFFKLF